MDEYTYQMQQRSQRSLINAAFVFAIISVATMMIFFISVPCGALAIIFALLSRRDVLARRAKIAVVGGILGIVISLTFTTYTVYTTIDTLGGWNNFLKEYQDYANELGYDIDLGIDDSV